MLTAHLNLLKVLSCDGLPLFEAICGECVRVHMSCKCMLIHSTTPDAFLQGRFWETFFVLKKEVLVVVPHRHADIANAQEQNYMSHHMTLFRTT